MQTRLPASLLHSAEGQRADAILRRCVHCGFCTATCPTYRLLGDELDSPRGRIYLIKSMLEGEPATRRTQLHLDRCLHCAACETTCPSGVEYTRLLAIGRRWAAERIRRPLPQVLTRALLRAVVPHRRRFARLLRLARRMRFLLPPSLRRQLHVRMDSGAPMPAGRKAKRKVILMQGCVQKSLSPATEAATRRVLARAGIACVTLGAENCCGALNHHLDAEQRALDEARRNIDAWWPQLEAGAEAIVVTASACGLMVKDYGELLAGDPAYAEKARRVSAAVRDPIELLEDCELPPATDGAERLIAFHPPCTLQHGLRLDRRVEDFLRARGFRLVDVRDRHLCCGSAGTYAILQPALSRRLRADKLDKLTREQPDCIVTANIGCQHHLQAATELPVFHWIELLDAPDVRGSWLEREGRSETR